MNNTRNTTTNNTSSKMTGRFTIAALFAALMAVCLILSGCSSSGSGSDKELTVDVQALADALNEKTVTSDTLTATTESMLPTIYLIDADVLKEGAAYMSSGATAGEVAVFALNSADDTANVREILEQRVASQKELYASYNADEVSRLDTAIIRTAGSYAVLCVCDDPDQAEEILKEYGF